MRKFVIAWLILTMVFGLPIAAVGEAEPLVTAAPSVTAETENSPAPGPDIIVNENSFLYQTGRMNENPAEYIGKTVRIEGMFGTFHYVEEDDLQTYHMVYRYFEGNNCCAADVTGLEVYWPEQSDAYPEEDTWVRTEGVLETYEVDGTTYLQARLTSLELMDDPGEALVME